MQTRCLGAPGKLSECSPGELIRIKWSGTDRLAIVAKDVPTGKVLVYLPFGAEEPSAGTASTPGKLVVRYGTDWMLEMITVPDVNLRGSPSETVGSALRSSTGTHLCVRDTTPNSFNDPVFVNLENNSFGDLEGPVIETQRWKIWASPEDCDADGKVPLYDYMPPS